MRVDQYTTKKFSFVCLNLEPQHYEFLKEIANTRFDGSSYHAIFYFNNSCFKTIIRNQNKMT